jgi:hypothetical protein
MKILKIEVSEPKILKKKRSPHCVGRITIGNFYESFYMFLTIWSIEDYKSQWKEGLERLKSHDRSCLIADMSFYDDIINLEIYYLYKIENKVMVQNQMWRPQTFTDLKNDPLPFDPFATGEDKYKNLREIKYIDEDGNKLEIWEADLDGIVIDNL